MPAPAPLDPRAPTTLGGYRVVAATAHACSWVRNGDGSPVYYAGVARLTRADGQQTVVWYDQSRAQVYGQGLFARDTALGVDYVARWVSPASARKNYRNILSESL